MLLFVVRRFFYSLFILLLLTVLSFGVMQLKPGDSVTGRALQLSEETMAQIRELYGLDQPAWQQYGKWIYGIVGRPSVDGAFPFIHFQAPDFGKSFETAQPVIDHLFLNGDRIWWTLLLTVVVLLFTWLVALPLGIYLATTSHRGGKLFSIQQVRQEYTQFKYQLDESLKRHNLNRPLTLIVQIVATIFHIAFILIRWFFLLLINTLSIFGLSMPNFLTAILILWLLVAVFQVGSTLGLGISGLFDAEYRDAPWSIDKFINFLWHLWPVLLVVSLGNIAQLIRYARANLLDVLGEPYIQTARAKGLRENVVVYKHAVRNALNPLISLLGFWIPLLFEGLLVAAIVFQLPIVERAFWTALANEDQYVVMTGLLFFGLILVVGNLLSDVLLAVVNPKIRYE